MTEFAARQTPDCIAMIAAQPIALAATPRSIAGAFGTVRD